MLNHVTRLFAGDAFELKEFHDEVLSLGNAPLSILERHIEQWIDTTRAEADTAATTCSITGAHLLAAIITAVIYARH